MRRIECVLALVAVAAMSGACAGLDLDRPTPYPSVEAPDGVPSAVIDVARAHVVERSDGPTVVRAAFAVDLADYVIATDPGERGWGVVFSITGRDGQPRNVLIVLSGDLAFMQSQE